MTEESARETSTDVVSDRQARGAKPGAFLRRTVKALKVFAGLLLLLVLAGATVTGSLVILLIVALLASVCLKLLARIIALFRKNVYMGLWTQTFSAESRPYLMQAGLRTALWLVMGVCVAIAIVPIQFTAEELREVVWTVWICVAILCVLETLPRRKLSGIHNAFYGLVLAFLLFQLCKVYMPVNTDKALVLSPPFKGAWYTVHGGNSALINHHHYAGSQRWAMDLLLAEDMTVPEANKANLDAYRTFGQPILSPVDGTVAETRNDAEDQPIGSSDLVDLAGNRVVIRTASGPYVLLAHLRKGSVTVKEGDAVHAGQPVGLCGNSGNTSQPHLHIHAMTQEDFSSSESKPVRMLFRTAGEGPPRFCNRNDVLVGP